MPNDQYQEVLLVIVTSVLVLGLLIGTMVVLMLIYQKKRFRHLEEKRNMQAAYEKNLLQSQLEIQEKTFEHISREIHDNVGQLLSLVKVQLNIALKRPDEELINEIKQNVGQAMVDLRDIARSLNASRLHQTRITDAISEELQRIGRSGVFSYELIVGGNAIFAESLNEQKKIILFRIVQESLQNIIKHASANLIRVRVDMTEEEISVQITDDGVGFDPNTLEYYGLGLENIRKRAAMAGGEATIASSPGNGTTISIQIPYV